MFVVTITQDTTHFKCGTHWELPNKEETDKLQADLNKTYNISYSYMRVYEKPTSLQIKQSTENMPKLSDQMFDVTLADIKRAIRDFTEEAHYMKDAKKRIKIIQAINCLEIIVDEHQTLKTAQIMKIYSAAQFWIEIIEDNGQAYSQRLRSIL